MAYLHAVSTVEALTSSSADGTANDFWNLDDILAEEEVAPCSFKFEAKGLGYLDQLNHLSTSATTAQRKQAIA